jgi:hypothetical protein
MKRRHKRLHLLIWLLLAPTIAAILYLSITLRPSDPIDNMLPESLVEELR